MQFHLCQVQRAKLRGHCAADGGVHNPEGTEPSGKTKLRRKSAREPRASDGSAVIKRSGERPREEVPRQGSTEKPALVKKEGLGTQQTQLRRHRATQGSMVKLQPPQCVIRAEQTAQGA